MKDKSASRPRNPDGLGLGTRIWFLFLTLVMTAVALVALINATSDLTYAAGLRGSPVRMEIKLCDTTGSGKATRTTCYGDPVGSTDGFGVLAIDGKHAKGSVLDVRCDRDGHCTEAGLGPAASDLALDCIGLFFLSGAVVGGTVFVQSFRRRWPGGAGPRPGLKRALKIWFGALGALLVLSGIVAIIS